MNPAHWTIAQYVMFVIIFCIIFVFLITLVTLVSKYIEFHWPGPESYKRRLAEYNKQMRIYRRDKHYTWKATRRTK